MRIVFTNFRMIDEEIDAAGSLSVDKGIIAERREDAGGNGGFFKDGGAAIVIDGKRLAPGKKNLPLLMPAFVDLHAHFREYYEIGGSGGIPAIPPAETLESGCLAAAAGGFGSVICMANTRPVIDTMEAVVGIRRRTDPLGLIDLYPVMSLTRGMEGKELSAFVNIPRPEDGARLGNLSLPGPYKPLMLSEDGKDIADDGLFLAAMKGARRLGLPLSCHCDFGGNEAAAQKKAGLPREVWSRTAENNATARVIALGREAGCHIHIAHVSTKEAVGLIRKAKAAGGSGGFRLTSEATPHNICLTERDADRMASESFGRVNPPLRDDEDRHALIEGLLDGTIDAIASDHAPHVMSDKARGAPGFSGLETAFAACFTEFSAANAPGAQNLRRLSFLMSANPARIAGLSDRGRLDPGMKADMVIIDEEDSWIVEPSRLKTRGKNSPFSGKRLCGKVLMTIHNGSIIYDVSS